MAAPHLPLVLGRLELGGVAMEDRRVEGLIGVSRVQGFDRLRAVGSAIQRMRHWAKTQTDRVVEITGLVDGSEVSVEDIYERRQPPTQSTPLRQARADYLPQEEMASFPRSMGLAQGRYPHIGGLQPLAKSPPEC